MSQPASVIFFRHAQELRELANLIELEAKRMEAEELARRLAKKGTPSGKTE